MPHKMKLIDTATGELINTPLYVPPSRQPTIYGARWYQMSQEASDLLAKDADIKGQTHRVLWYLLDKLDFENYITITQKKIAKELSMYQPDVSKSFKILISKGIVLKEGVNSYRLNPAYGWKGSNKKARDYQLELIKGGKTNNE